MKNYNKKTTNSSSGSQPEKELFHPNKRSTIPSAQYDDDAEWGDEWEIDDGQDHKAVRRADKAAYKTARKADKAQRRSAEQSDTLAHKAATQAGGRQSGRSKATGDSAKAVQSGRSKASQAGSGKVTYSRVAGDLLKTSGGKATGAKATGGKATYSKAAGDLPKTSGGKASGTKTSGTKTTGTKSRCPYSKKCGGCTMIDVPMDQQLRDKQAWVEECIGEFGEVQPILRMKNPDRYRGKVTSIFGLDRKGHPVCGVYRGHSHEIVPVKDCLIENKRADAIIQTIYGMLPGFKIRVYDEAHDDGIVKAVQIRTGHATHEVMVTIVTAGPILPSSKNLAKALVERHPEITTIVQNINDRYTTMILGEREKVLYGKGYIEDELLGKRFRISSRSFYQVNPIQTDKLYNVALDMAALTGKETVLDAYCGTGTIGICAADKAAKVISVELNPDAAHDAARNVEANGLQNVTVINADATQFMQELQAEDAANATATSKAPVDVILMDPPRSGSTPEFIEAATALMPSRIVYVSCNPETLGRDLAVFEDCGYEMRKAIPVDMFPYTEDVETVVLMTQMKD